MKGKFWDINNLTSLDAVASEVLDGLEGQADAATVLALHGDLGAGKTTFVQTIARQLGVEEVVTSPTFVVMKNYSTVGQTWKMLVHIDAYRLESNEELVVLGFADVLLQPHTLVCIEWAEKVKELLPPKTVHLNFKHEKDGRQIHIS